MDASKTSSIRNILKLMKSWINNVMINKGDVSSIATFDKKLHNHFVLNNLFYLTIKYSDVYITEIEDLWIALIQKIIPHSNSQIIPESNSTSAAYIIDYLLDVCSRSQNENFLSASKLITIILSRTKSCQCVVDSLLSRIIPSTINSTIQISDSVSTSAALNDYCISLDKIESKKLPLISRGQLALLFLVDLTLEIDINLIKQHLSTLLTAIFVQLDHEFKIISDGCRELLIKLLYSFIPADLAGGEIETITGFIVNQDKFWLDEETSLSNRNNSSNVKLDDFVSQITDLFSLVDTNFPQTWGHKALYWSINCSIRNISSRSLQILRSIVPVFTRQMVDDLLLRLADILANKSLVEQRFSLEILTTLDVMFDSLEQHRVILFPQFFWVGIACLYSQHECEYVYGVKILRKFLDVVDLSDLSTRRMIQNTIPSQFQSIFGGLITLLSRGICSSLCEQNCVYLINKLIKVSDWSFFIGPIIEKKTRNDLFVMYALMVNIPLLMMDLDNNVTSSESCDVAQHLSNLCYSLGYSDLGRIMDSFSKQKFKGKKDIDSLIANSLFVSFKDEMPTLFEFFLSGISSPLPKNKYILKILAQIQKKKPNLVFKTFNFNIIYPLHNSKETMFMEVLAGCIEAEIELSSSCTRPFLQNISFSDLSKATAVKELQSINKTALPFSETGWFQDGSDNSNYCRTLLSNLISCANISIESGNENLKNEFNISFDQLDTMTRIEAIDELDKMIMQYIGKFDQIDTKSLLSEYRSITTSLHETCLVESTHVYANIQNLNSTMTTTERLLFIKESKLYFVLRIKISALNLKDNGIMKVLCEDLSKVLEIDSERVIISNVFRDTSEASLIHVKFTFDNLTNAKYMEILLDTIRKGQSTEKGRLLMNSSISHEIDFNHDPCIFIEYFDKLVPYVLIPWILEETTRDVLTACDLFKIFPASQELATLFYTQFIKLVESRIGDENIRDVYQGICRIDINSFKPLLFRSGEFKSEMSRVVDFYIAFRNRDGMFLKTFENLRCEILYELGIKTDACVILAQKIRGVSSTREIIEYGIAVLCVYSVNLELQGLVTLLVGDVHQEKLRIDLLQQVDRVRGLFEASLV